MTTLSRPSFEPATPAEQPTQVVPERVRAWIDRIKSRKNLKDFQDWKELTKQAREFFKGNLLEEDERAGWQKDTVELNMWRRIANFFVDAIFSANPNIAVRPNDGRVNDETLAWASAVEAFVKYVWRECKLQKETKRALKAAYFDNVAFAKLDYDAARGLYRTRHCQGTYIVDPECHGDLSRAMWAAEELTLPAVRILSDDTFPLEKRKELARKWGLAAKKPECQKTIWYLYSREGSNPGGIVDELLDEGQPEQGSKRKLLVMVEEMEDFLLEVDDPCPYLDEDEFNVAFLCLDEMPGEFYGSPFWEMLRGMIRALNWLMTFHLATMKKAATRIILANKAIVKNPAELANLPHMSVKGVDGPPSEAAAPLDLGAGDLSALEGASRIKEWLDVASGFNEIAQGQSSGRKTAKEAEYLQSNTSLVTKGPNQALDEFISEQIRLIGLSSLYYIPAFSRTVGPDGTVMMRQAVKVPVPPPMMQPGPEGGDPGQEPQAPPAEGGQPPQPPGAAPGQPPQPQMQTILQDVPAPPEEAQELGAVPWQGEAGEDFGLRMPDTQMQMTPEGVPQFQHPSPGKVLRQGIDSFMGDEVAGKWPTVPFDQVKRDLLLTFEAGSTGANFRYDQQQIAQNAITVLAPMLMQAGALDQVYELMVLYTKSLSVSNVDRLIPSREQFVGGIQQAMMAQQQMAEKEAAAKAKGGEDGPPGKKSKASHKIGDQG